MSKNSKANYTRQLAAAKQSGSPAKSAHTIEAGIGGVESFMGFIQEAYTHELRWPAVQPIYARIRRSDPEISIVRQLFTSLVTKINLHFELPDNASDDEKRAQEFGMQVLDDMEGGWQSFMDTLISNVPFFGWGWFEVVHGIRSPDWSPSDPLDDWRSQYDDGLIGIRRLGFRDSGTFKSWVIDQASGKLLGMVQTPGIGIPDVTIPIENSLHVTFGDSNNPEGLSPLEAVWRLERIKYGLEIVQGIGFEHAAGYLNVVTQDNLSPEDKEMIKRSAKAIMTAQEGNYATWPKNVTGTIDDVNFSAAGAILQAIKYYGILKLSIYNSQWVSLSATTGSGSYSAMDDSSGMFLTTYNSMIESFVRQIDNQVFKKLFQINALSFPGMVNRPHLAYAALDKRIALAELGSFFSLMADTIILDDDDVRALRRKSGILADKIPESESESVIKSKSSPTGTALSMSDKRNMDLGRKAYLKKIEKENPELYRFEMSKENK